MTVLSVFRRFLILSALLSALCAPLASWGAWPNDKVIVTDMLDDDIRALLNLLSDPKTGNTIKAIVVSTGNTQLKAEIARDIIARFNLNIPVYAGTSSNLANNPTTKFAANFEAEGRHVLDEQTRWALKAKATESGSGAQELAALINGHSAQKPLDILCLTAPTDLITAMRADPVAAKAALGDLFIMGMYKQTANGSLAAPYNAMAGPQSIFDLMDLHDQGYFAHAYHVPSDTVQLRSGLPGGYFPEDAPGQALRSKLLKIMNDHAGLEDVLKAAQEYGLSWHSTAIQQHGVGITDESRWVPASLKAPHEASGFYIADTIPAVLSNMSQQELDALQFAPGHVAPPANSATLDVTKPFNFQKTGPGQGRAFLDLQHFDGPKALEQHVSNLAQIAPYLTVPRASAAVKAGAHLATNAAKGASVLVKGVRQAEALILTFKNSPDDWMGVLKLLSSPRGRVALSRGGIICEGFETTETAKSVKAWLKSMKITDIPVAAGHQYSAAEVDSIPNFKLERNFYANNQGSRAFKDLIAAEKVTTKDLVATNKLIGRSTGWAKANSGKIDLVILGEGLDTIRAYQGNPKFAQVVGKAYVMGGGRVEADGKITFTRNWLPHKDEVLKGLEDMGRAGHDVGVFSTNEFGGSLVARTDAPLGNGAVAFKSLEEAGAHSSGAKAVLDHWGNWTRNADWTMSKTDGQAAGKAFEAGKEVRSLAISPLGLHVTDGWLNDTAAPGTPGRTLMEVSPSTMVTSGKLDSTPGTGINWIKQTGGQSIEPLAIDFKGSIETLADSKLAKNLDQAVRDYAVYNAKVVRARSAEALILTFKNSPDDWMGLLKLVSTERGKLALLRGGIICEGFETTEMAKSVKAWLRSLNISDIPVAIGHQYAAGEIDAIPNFKLESNFYANQQGSRAFNDLVAAEKVTAKDLTTPKKLIGQSTAWAKANSGKIDLVILGEGLDTIRAYEANPKFAQVVGKAYVMGGGRIQDEKIAFTRNWLPHKEEVLKGLEDMGRAGHRVSIFSTNEFGGSLVARTDAPLGNGAVAFKSLEEASARSPAVQAVLDHWGNWTRNADWTMSKTDGQAAGKAFEAGKEVRSLAISPLGLHVTDGWLNQAGEPGVPGRTLMEVSPSALIGTGKFDSTPGTGVNWIKQTGGQSIEPLAVSFKGSIDSLVDISNTEPARRFDQAVRDQGIYSPQAALARAEILAGDKVANAPREAKRIFVSFTTKGQDFKTQILPKLQKLARDNPDAILVHGFASREFLQSKQISTEVLDAMESLFPGRLIQMNNSKGVADQSVREQMAEMAAQSKSPVYVIGDDAAVGVADEMKLYAKAGVKINKVAVVPHDAKKIFVSFTTKGQDFKTQILPKLQKLAHDNPDAILVHGFASREFLQSKGISTEVLDAMENLFPGRLIQMNNAKGVADNLVREQMAKMAVQSSGAVYVIGDETAPGVADEVKLYAEAGSKVNKVAIVPKDAKKIFVSFSTKGQDFKTQILPKLQKIAREYPDAILVHGFASREFLQSKGISTEVLDAMEALFPGRLIQMNNNKGVADQPVREQMAQMAADFKSPVYVIGDDAAVGVADEMKLYAKAGVKINKVAVVPHDAKKIFVSFTTKGQDFKTQILPKLQKLARDNPDAILVHGFASREFLQSKQISTEVLDAMDTLFPRRQIQMNNSKGVADQAVREQMAKMAAHSKSPVYVIGDVAAAGVADELRLYAGAGIKVNTIAIVPAVTAAHADVDASPRGGRFCNLKKALGELTKQIGPKLGR